jgi:hypothetical protein
VFPADAPKWLKDSIKDLTKLDLGCHYTSLLAALIRLEGLARYEPQKSGPQRLPSPKATPRPAAISDWVRGGRGTKTKNSPTVKDVAKYAREWDHWWDSLQPEWRMRKLGEAPGWRVDVAYRDDWEWGALDCYGVNGLLSAVAGLYFWGVAVASGPEEQLARWDDTVQDVVWVLEGLQRTFK